MGVGREARSPDLSDHHPPLHALARLHEQLGSVPVTRHVAEAVVDLDRVAVTRAPPGIGHPPLRGREDRRTLGSGDVDARVGQLLVVDRVVARCTETTAQRTVRRQDRRSRLEQLVVRAQAVGSLGDALGEKSCSALERENVVRYRESPLTRVPVVLP